MSADDFSQRQRQCVDKQIPPEIWLMIFARLYPSQLSRLSRVSRTLHLIIGSLPFWKQIYEFTHPDMKPLRLLRGQAHFKSYMVYICVISRHLCEVCFRLSNFQEPNRSHLPLPVLQRLHTISSATGVEHVGELINWSWTIRRCRLCRDRNSIDKCEDHSAPWKETKTKSSFFYNTTIYSYRNIGEWKVSFPPLAEIPEVATLRGSLAEPRVMEIVLSYFGGDVGASAAKEKTLSDDNRTWDRILWYRTQD